MYTKYELPVWEVYASLAAIVTLLLDCVFQIVGTQKHTQKHRSWLSTREDREVWLLLYRGCHKVNNLEDGVVQLQQQQTAKPVQNTKLKLLFLRLTASPLRKIPLVLL